jgi:para-aminobenzoate synthetase component I
VTVVVPLAPSPDPFGTCVRFSGCTYLLFLDSSAQGSLGRYSFLAADPVAVVRTPDAARQLLRAHRLPPLPGLPPFQGGCAGYLGYESGSAVEHVARPAADLFTPRLPDAQFALYDWVIAWDHLEEKAWLVSTGIGAGGKGRSDERATARAAWVRERLAAVPAAIRDHPAPTPAPPISNFERVEFETAVSRIREYIAAGDVYQVNLSQRFHAPFAGAPLALYRRLRARNPAPFGAYLEFAGASIASISPERFLRLDGATREAEARPIKGTRPRGHTPEKDVALARELVESEKDRAENVMIVDLLRNDLGKVCRTGSVAVTRLFALESHPTVHHLVSTVTGVLRDDADAFDLLQAAFPGGSVTGAPKIRAMQIIAELEPTARGVYCGSIGYLSVTGALDTSIVIRTYLVLGEEVYFQVGGGIVADSAPDEEYRETLDKARGLIAALGAT